MYAELDKRAKAVISPVVILQQAIFYDLFILCLWLKIIRRSDQSVYFMNFSSHIFLTILIMVTEQLYCRKTICGCFRYIWLWLLISIMKRCAERYALQLYYTSLTAVILRIKLPLRSNIKQTKR